MLNCRHVMHLSSEYLDGALPLHRRMAVRVHLFLCDACRRYLRQLRATVAAVGRWPEPKVSEDVLREQVDVLRKHL